MQKIRAYRATEVKNVCLGRVLEGRDGQRVDVGLDVGKETVFAVLRWSQSDFGRPWKVNNPLSDSQFFGVAVGTESRA